MPLIPPCHTPGKHCASTGVRNMVAFHGCPLSEAMCFGIGEGLGLWYLDLPDMTPSRMVHVRSADFESRFFSNLGLAFCWETREDPVDSEADLLAAIDRGVPAIIQTDIFHLPYYTSKTHFPGHIITVWGYDRGKETFMVTDTERAELLDVPMAILRKARYCSNGFFSSRGNLYAPPSLTAPEELAPVIRKAICANSRALSGRELAIAGRPALEKWQRELPSWSQLADWQWAARFCYQVIEKRGTGGGGFRKLYAAFLAESAPAVEEIRIHGLDARMERIAEEWTGLALSLKAASEREKPSFEDVRQCLSALAEEELCYHEDVLRILSE